jgi:hypothetical protein
MVWPNSKMNQPGPYIIPRIAHCGTTTSEHLKMMEIPFYGLGQCKEIKVARTGPIRKNKGPLKTC